MAERERRGESAERGGRQNAGSDRAPGKGTLTEGLTQRSPLVVDKPTLTFEGEVGGFGFGQTVTVSRASPDPSQPKPFDLGSQSAPETGGDAAPGPDAGGIVVAAVKGGAHSADFEVSPLGSHELMPGDSMVLHAGFTPHEPGQRSATIELFQNFGAGPTSVITLLGTASPAPEVTASGQSAPGRTEGGDTANAPATPTPTTPAPPTPPTPEEIVQANAELNLLKDQIREAQGLLISNRKDVVGTVWQDALKEAPPEQPSFLTELLLDCVTIALQAATAGIGLAIAQRVTKALEGAKGAEAVTEGVKTFVELGLDKTLTDAATQRLRTPANGSQSPVPLNAFMEAQQFALNTARADAVTAASLLAEAVRPSLSTVPKLAIGILKAALSAINAQKDQAPILQAQFTVAQWLAYVAHTKLKNFGPGRGAKRKK